MERSAVLDTYRSVRALTVELCEPLEPEDFRIQTITDVSPPWWNLGHTTWFFAKNVLEPWGRYTEADRRLEYVLNSHYEAYPGYRPFDGNLAEYNGKFMDNQRVLRGGSYATPRSHIRVSYRNFWPPETRFQLTGLRLARLAD